MILPFVFMRRNLFVLQRCFRTKDMVYFPNKEGELKLNNLIKTKKLKVKDYDFHDGIWD